MKIRIKGLRTRSKLKRMRTGTIRKARSRLKAREMARRMKPKDSTTREQMSRNRRFPARVKTQARDRGSIQSLASSRIPFLSCLRRIQIQTSLTLRSKEQVVKKWSLEKMNIKRLEQEVERGKISLIRKKTTLAMV